MIARFLTLTIFGMVLAPTLADLYANSSLFGFDDLVNIGIINTLFACLVAVVMYDVKADKQTTLHRIDDAEKIAWTLLPSLLVLGGCFLLIFLARKMLPPADYTFTFHNQYILMIVWIPIVEELVFRVGFGSYFRQQGGYLWGGYLSALFFSVMHTMPTASRIQHGDVGVAIGPLLLGIICEIIYVRTKMLTPIIAFHMTCNATVLVFDLFEPRWLSWLSFLYG